MLEERFRFMYVGRRSTDLKQISLSRRQFYLCVVFSLCVLLLIMSVSVNLCTNGFHNFQIVLLKKDREHFLKESLAIKEQVASLYSLLAKVERDEANLRNMAGLPAIDKDIRQLGVGGPIHYGSLDFGHYPDEIGRTTQEEKVDLEKLQRSVQLEMNSLQEISQKLTEQKERVSQFPSINPILDGRVRDGFGRRIDPFIGKIVFHEGIDIPMPLGTQVLATADGVVKVAKIEYIPHNSYGIEVVIDHDYGYQTRYAHLSHVLVRAGQRVKRWDVIGEVGDTGKATGPHLHYEVIDKENPQNPEWFIFNGNDGHRSID